MRLIIPGVLPSVNHMYRNARVGNRNVRVLSPEAERWARTIDIQATVWRVGEKWKTATGKVIVRLWYYWPDNRKRDTHNTLKLLLDVLESAGIYDNDKNALPQIMDWEVDRKYPRVEIEFLLKEESA